MNEDLRRCLESILNAMGEIRTIRGKLMTSDLYKAQEEFGLSNEMMRLILSLK